LLDIVVGSALDIHLVVSSNFHTLQNLMLAWNIVLGRIPESSGKELPFDDLLAWQKQQE